MMQSLLIAAALVMVSRWIGGVPGAWAAASGWLVLASPTVLLTLQAGNFQVTVYSLAMIALVLVSTGRELSGAAMLAYATVGKIVPGVLVLFLLTARRWRAVGLHGRVLPAALRDHHRGVRVEADGRFHLVRDAEDREWRGVPADGNAQHAADEPVGVWRNRAAATAARGVVRPQLVWPGRRPADRLDLRHHRRAPDGRGRLARREAWMAGEGNEGTGMRDREPRSITPETRIRLAQLVLALLSLMAFRSPFVGSIYGYLGTLWLLTLLAAGASTPMRRGAGWPASACSRRSWR